MARRSAAGRGAPQVSHGALDGLIEQISGKRPASLSPDANLAADLQLSSIDRVQLLSAIEDRYQVDLNESGFTSASTVADLERMLRHPVPRRSDYQYPKWARSHPVRWVRLAVYYALTWPATMVMARPKIVGREKLRLARGPVLAVANHVTMVDVGLVLAALPPRFRHRLAVAMIGERLQAMRHPPEDLSFFRRWLDKLDYVLVVALFNVFPLPQESGFRESFAFAGESVDRGYNVLVFPEGMRTRDGRLSPFQSGVGLLSNNLNVPIVPLRIDGLFDAARTRRKVVPPGKIQVRIGDPVRFAPDSDPAIAKALEDRVRKLG